MKNPMTPAGIEPATFRFVAQHLDHCLTYKAITFEQMMTWWSSHQTVHCHHRPYHEHLVQHFNTQLVSLHGAHSLHSVIFLGRYSQNRAEGTSFLRFLDHTQPHTHPVGLPWTSDQLEAEAATYTIHNTHNRRRSTRDSNPQSQKASGRRPTP